MIKSDPIKQITIQAQHATGQAVQLVISGNVKLEAIEATARRIMQIEQKLIGEHLEIYKQIADKSRLEDVKLILDKLKMAQTKEAVNALFFELTEDEQPKYKKQFESKLKTIK